MGDRTVRLALGVGMVCGALFGQEIDAQTIATDTRSGLHSNTTPVSVQVTNVDLETVLDMIARQAGLKLYVPSRVVQPPVKLSMQVRDMPADDAFAKALEGTGWRAVIRSGAVLLVDDRATRARVAQGSITGKVIDGKTRQGLRGATVSISGTGKATTTSDDGSFRVSGVVPGAYTIHVRMLGYVKISKLITIVEGQAASFEIAIEPSVNALDQIVVTGTVAATAQREVPNAMTVITAKDIEQLGITKIDQLFRGDVPGLFSQNRGSYAQLDQIVMFSRGATSFVAAESYTNAIKTYVDGIELADPSYLTQIDPKSIERIEILTGPQASTIYGSNAINGVMQVFTKRGTADATTRPQLTATLLSGIVQNNFSTALTPQHDYAVQVNGTEGRWAYQAGSTWNYLGPWTPGKQLVRMSGFGGGRMRYGPITADASLRLGTTRSIAKGGTNQAALALRETGEDIPVAINGRVAPTTSTLNGQTLGLTFGFAPAPWWSHEFVVGTDASDVAVLVTGSANTTPNDTLQSINQTHSGRSSLRYVTTLRVPVTSLARAAITVGVDQWRSLITTMGATSSALTGTLTTPRSPTRLPSHNTGAFVQGQLGIWDALFVTYGLRAEWNPNYGDDVGGNFAPRYGIAYTRETGPLTTKLRASYGRSTRPPTSTKKMAQPETFASSIATYGQYMLTLASPELEPEYQQGGEGGLEFYLGNRGSLIVTRYNQTVDGLIANPWVDSVRSLVPSSSTGLYTYSKVYQNLNIGSIRNQGWELQGTVNTGPFITRGTYSWTKSRVLGITPKYRALLTGIQYQPGRAFDYLPEHTWAINTTYAYASTTVSLNLNGTGSLFRFNDLLFNSQYNARLITTKLRMVTPPNYRPAGPGYTMADLSATHRFAPRVEGVLHINNVTNFYQNDYAVIYAAMGRQTRAGLRMRF